MSYGTRAKFIIIIVIYNQSFISILLYPNVTIWIDNPWQGEGISLRKVINYHKCYKTWTTTASNQPLLKVTAMDLIKASAFALHSLKKKKLYLKCNTSNFIIIGFMTSMNNCSLKWRDCVMAKYISCAIHSWFEKVHVYTTLTLSITHS